MFASEKKIVGWHVAVGLVALGLGSLFGPLQALEHMGINVYPFLQPLLQSYYQGLTLHAVLNAEVWTTFFITGFLTLAVVRSLNRPLAYRWISHLGLGLMLVGLVMAAIPLLFNMATVLYTFYPPMQASAFFYIGLTLVVVGSWVVGYSLYFTYGVWRKENRGVPTPFIAQASLITMVMWQIATLGVAAEMLTMNIPWSLGLLKGTDPQLARTLFWFTGHPLVYFWLLPAYISWYGMVPKQAGGKLFSEQMGRLAFWLFLLLSVPLGFHHQYVDPGVPAGWKYLHAVLTFAVFIPSLLTAFNIVASLEIGGKARGGKGLFGWILKLPWNEPSFTAQALAMILFAFGGVSGLINASYNINLVIHNTAWVPGHFHLTVGTAVTLTFIGVLYWLLPHLTGKKLWNRKVALWQAGLWFVGMATMSRGMHSAGLLGVPRRTMLGVALGNYGTADWNVPLLMAGVGGTILLVSGILLFLNVIMTVFFSKEPATVDMPIAESLRVETVPSWLNSFKPWLVAAAALIVVAYVPMLYLLIRDVAMTSPGFNVWQ
jgi:cytochrome c oxidase subunit 1